MFIVYRSHLVMLLDEGVLTAEMAELATRMKLPLKVSAGKNEGFDACYQRAVDLIDLYLAPPDAISGT